MHANEKHVSLKQRYVTHTMVISKENQHRQVLRLSEIENSPSPVFEGKPYKSSEVNRLVHL